MTNIDLLWVILGLILVGKAFHLYQTWATRKILNSPERIKAAAAEAVRANQLMQKLEDLLQLIKGNAALSKVHTQSAEQAVQEVRTAVAPIVSSTGSSAGLTTNKTTPTEK